MYMIFEVTVFISTLFICILAYFKRKYLYWQNKNIPCIEPHIPFGTIGNPFTRKQNLAFVVKKHYEYLKSLGHKCGGMYFFVRPSLLAVDLDLIRNIMSKDFQYFTDRGTYYNEKYDPLSANLFNLEGHKWRHLRTKLTPTFTSGKIKMMFPTLIACGDPMISSLNNLIQTKEPLEIKDVLARFTTDVIGSCAFGLECNSFKETESDFRKYGKMIFTDTSKLQRVKTLLAFSVPSLAKHLGITVVRSEPKEFFLEVVRKTVEYRKANNIVRNDFIHILMNLESEDGEELTIEQIAAQAFIFWFAGFETSSTAMTFCLCELAVNHNIQDVLRNEILTVLNKHNRELTYEAVAEMKYLNQVVEETLRKYPPGTLVPRISIHDYNLPGTDIVLPKGTRITIPIYALHHDPDYFPNPETFDPERFGAENRINIRPFTYMPFGEGPRNCIGLRFGLLQTKVGLIILLKHFKFYLNSKTEMPLKFDRFNFILTAESGVWLNIEKL